MDINKLTQGILYGLIAVFLVMGGYGWGVHETKRNYIPLPAYVDPAAFDFELFFQVYQELNEKFVDKSKLDQKKMFYGAIKGMTSSLEDPYTFFLTPDENKKSKDDLNGKLEGIGAQLETKDGMVTIIGLLKNSPAENANLRVGDIITEVNNKPIQGQQIQEVVSQIRGPKGTNVILDIMRNKKPLEFTITRAEIQATSMELTYVKPAVCPNCSRVALIRLQQFGGGTVDEWNTAVQEVKQKYQNQEIAGLIVDVRNNPGGYLQASVALSSDFLNSGDLVVTQVGLNNEEIPYTALPSGRLQNVPTIVLINKYSASASEIMAGALKAHKKAILVGETTFGKGSVQAPVDLDKNAGLHVTIAKWILPDGTWIHGKGVKPDIAIQNDFKEEEEYTEARDLQLQEGIKQLLQ